MAGSPVSASSARNHNNMLPIVYNGFLSQITSLEISLLQTKATTEP
jgi:hypothetical protein